jgi:hypothetical protein
MEPSFPEALADHGHRVSALLVAVLFGGEEPAEDWPDAEHGEVIPGDQLAADALGMLVVAEAHRFRPRYGQAGEQLQVVAVIAVVGVGDGQVVAVGRDALERYQLIAVGDAGDGVHQRGVDPTEHGGVGGDADGQREHRDQGEAGASPGHAKAIAQVLEEGPHGAYCGNCRANG